MPAPSMIGHIRIIIGRHHRRGPGRAA
jgi:hypothetical protein